MLQLLKNAEWKPFLDLLSPRFVDVVPMSTVLSQARILGGNYFDAAAFATARQARAGTLAASGLIVKLVDALPGPAAPVPGHHVLDLYFHQVLCGGTVLLDLRAECFAPYGDGLAWSPRPAFVTLDADFHRGVRDLYLGFYQDDPARFSAATRALGLEAAEVALRAQFGDGDQTQVRFSLPEFQRRFQAVFEACKKHRARLHPGFIGLGIGLATLYNHLEQSGGAYDVRAAFLRAASGVARR